MRLKQNIYAGLLLITAVSAPVMATAQSAPFMVIRFNQQRMYYEQPLYNAVAKAVAIKPEVMFDVVAVAPRTGDSEIDRAWQERSRTNVQHVVSTFNSIGVPTSRLTISYAQQDSLRFDEVHVSAR